MGTSTSVHPVFHAPATMMEAAQTYEMDLHSSWGLNLPAALHHHSLLAKGYGLLGGATVPWPPLVIKVHPVVCQSNDLACLFAGKAGCGR